MNSRSSTARGRRSRREIAIQFQTAGRIYRFDPGSLDLKRGDRVVVEADRGTLLGSVVAAARIRRGGKGKNLRRVVKKADSRDRLRDDRKRQAQKSAQRLCVDRIREHHMALKLVRAEYVLDGTKLVFYFVSEKGSDTRELARELADRLQVRVEFKQVGAREETKIAGGVGPCGRELCCASWLREFVPISVKMAKEQDLAPNHSRLAGMCGRLKCCLRYEFDTYVALKKGLPRPGKNVESVKGNGEVVRQNVLRQTVTIRRAEDGCEFDATLEDLVVHNSDA